MAIDIFAFFVRFRLEQMETTATQVCLEILLAVSTPISILAEPAKSIDVMDSRKQNLCWLAIAYIQIFSGRSCQAKFGFSFILHDLTSCFKLFVTKCLNLASLVYLRSFSSMLYL